ncbi:substrate-binding domain-containing protein [Streptomyces sp. NPDC059477]|uniref:substrate-binding domain-containing protein n=1 Tax=Streptomyces sp. NPDC059477 TaxID=3346847 RepID=UPI00368EF90B
MNDQVERWIAVLSLAIPVAAFLWEFIVVGRKRLGYRVQMDTLAADATQSQHAEVLRGMERDGHRLKDPSFVLLRIENAGSTPIEAGDYLAPADDDHGITVTFPGRQVAAMVVTELSQRELAGFFLRVDETGQTVATSGFRFDNNDGAGVIRLPKATLPRGAEYKVLVVLERWPDDRGTGAFPAPEFVGAVGSNSRWHDPVMRFLRLKLARTESHVFASRPAWYGIWVLTAAVIAQAVLVFVPNGLRPPLDCVAGELKLSGSTAFAPAVRAAAEDMVERCEGSGLSIPLADDDFQGSTDGITELEHAGEQSGISVHEGLGDHLAFSDGEAEDNHTALIAHPVGVLVFAVVVNVDTQVAKLDSEKLRGIFSGEIKNWSEVGKGNLPVRVINREAQSGTRAALVDKVLGKQPNQFTETDCAAFRGDKKTYGRCEVGDTDTMLRMVREIPGAIGYSEAGAVGDTDADTLAKIHIGDAPATVDGVEDRSYPFWQTEFAYTYGIPPAGSVAAAFLTFLTQQAGRDSVREHGHGLCSDMRDPGECSPEWPVPTALPS